MTLVALLAAVCTARASAWERPVDGPALRALELSGDRFARGQHRGVDLAAARGSVVRAACGGRVRFTGAVPGGGRTVSVGCGRFVATYGHLDAIGVRRGQRIEPGAAIGTVGRSGRPRGDRAHVHLGVREASSGRYVDPMALLGGVPRAAPPVVAGPRAPSPLGRAPRPGAPRPAVPPGFGPVPAPAPAPAPSSALPLVVWIGLAAFGLGLPLGGLVRHGLRRRAAKGVDVRAQVA